MIRLARLFVVRALARICFRRYGLKARTTNKERGMRPRSREVREEDAKREKTTVWRLILRGASRSSRPHGRMLCSDGRPRLPEGVSVDGYHSLEYWDFGPPRPALDAGLAGGGVCAFGD